MTGPWDSESVAETARAVTVPAGLLLITPSASGNELTELDDQGLLVSLVPPPKSEGEALANAIERDLEGADGKTVNVAGRSDAYGDDMTQAFIEAWQGRGGTIGGLTIYSTGPPVETSSDETSTTSEFDDSSSFDSSSTSFSSEASQITDGSPDAFVIADYAADFAGLASSLDSSGWDAETAWGTDGIAVPPTEEGAADSFEGMRAVVPGPPKDAEASTAFDDLFKSGDPKDVTQSRFAAQEFDATILCYLAAVKAGSIDGQKMADALVDITAPGGDEYTWEELPDAVEALENGDDIDYTGASGPINLNVDGDATAGVYDIFQYVEGLLDLSGEVPAESPEPPSTTDTDTTDEGEGE
jgi:branched-chain amino acid transport system substrate-binding protein